MPEYNLTVQASIPAALCSVHNFIQTYDPDEGDLPVEILPLIEHSTTTHDGHQVIDPGDEGTRELREFHDNIAVAMWEDYQCLLGERAMEYEDTDSNFEEFEIGEMSWHLL